MNTQKFAYLDFEYTGSHKEKMDVICCSVDLCCGTERDYWFDKNHIDVARFKELSGYLRKNDYILCSYNVVAEARAFHSLGIDPRDFQWICLHIEDKMLTNNNNKWGYGDQMLKSGKKVFTKNDSKWGKSEEELKDLNMSKPEKNLVSAAYRYLKVFIDSDQKKETLDLILEKKTEFSDQEKAQILKYCRSDIKYLKQIREVQFNYLTKFFSDSRPSRQAILPLILEHQLLRGRYSAETGIMEAVGYPVHPVWFDKFTKKSSEILIEAMLDINSQFEGSDFQPFRPKTKKNPRNLAGNQTAQRAWIEEKSGRAESWTLTATGKLSLSKDAWLKNYPYKHDYPRSIYPAQMVRYYKLKESLNGFLPGSKNKITDSYDPEDSRVRPYMGIYGAQSARSQPKATTFIPLKAAWSRVLIHPKDDKTFVCGIDYGSQEVLIQAILSEDVALYESYTSGDVYLDFAKKAGAVPEDGLRKDYEDVRDKFKSTFLGISYGMSAKGLATKLTNDTGILHTELDGQRMINTYFQVYFKYGEYLQKVTKTYEYDKFLILPCGWVIFGDNKNPRSVRNVPIQGTGSSIMRQAVHLSMKEHLKVIFTLHDALYYELSTEEEVDRAVTCMIKGFKDILKHPWAESIRVDVSCYGSYFKENEFKNKEYETKEKYVDGRAKKDYDFFSKYFIN